MLSSGAGAETRMVIGTVVLAGVLSATVFTLLIVPAAYRLLSRHSRIPGEVARRLEQERRQVTKGLAN
jgi:multidrug efflux pump